MSKDVMDEVFPEDDATAALPEQVEVEEATAEVEKPAPARGPDGKFAKAEADEGEEDGAPPAPGEDDVHSVPVGALKDERAKRQALERELAEVKAWRQRIEAQARDHQLRSIQDPDERMQAYQQQWQQAAVSQRLDMSRRYAERQHGAEFVADVVEFFNDPRHAPMSHQFMQTEDPFGAAVDYFNAQKALAEIGPDPKAYEARLREQLKAEIMAELSPTKPKAPPPSMASAPSSGGKTEPVGSGFDALFGPT